MKLVMTLVANINIRSVSPIMLQWEEGCHKRGEAILCLILQTLEDQKRRSNFVSCFCKHNKN
jgi:hypothetical protein